MTDDPRWREAIDAQSEQLRFWQSRTGAQYARAFERGLGVSVDTMLAIHQGMLTEAEPIYVSDDATLLIEEAQRTFRPEKLLESDLFTAVAFMLLPRPITLNDRQNKRVSVRALSWMRLDWTEPGGQERRGVWVSAYSHRSDPSERGPLPYIPGFPDLTLLHGQVLTFDRPWRAPEDATAAERDAMVEWQTTLQAIFRLTSQLIHTRHRPHRSARRSAERAGLKAVEEITVIQLRRTREDDASEHHDANYSHRFIVRGHWRNQWYASLDEHRQIWIAPFVKGPDDKPLVTKKRVFEFVR